MNETYLDDVVLKDCPCCGGSASVRYSPVANGGPERTRTAPKIQCGWCGLQTERGFTNSKYLEETWVEVYNEEVERLAKAWNIRFDG